MSPPDPAAGLDSSLSGNPTPAREEFANFVAKNNAASNSNSHPEDRHQREEEDEDEEDSYRNEQIDAAMRLPRGRPGGRAAPLSLPPASFDSGRATGVKGVIADARSYETARKTRWKDRVREMRRSVFGLEAAAASTTTGDSSATAAPSPPAKAGRGTTPGGSSDEDGELDDDEADFLREWRESRRRELEREGVRVVVNTRRTSPSVRLYGRFDQVDALGYLDAIEKVRRETVVVVFVTDYECDVSATVEAALAPLVREYPAVHFVKVNYDEVELDPAAVPSILAYKNQGELFANLVGVLEMIPDDTDLDTDAIRYLLQRHQVL